MIKQANEAIETIDELHIKPEQERMIAFAILTGNYLPLFDLLKNPFQENENIQGSEVYIAGKPSMGTVKELKKELINKGFKVKTKPEMISYVLLTSRINEKDITNIFNKNYSFFLEDHLKEQLIEEDTPYLLEESNSELINQITRLLKVRDEDQLALILPIIEGGGANKLIISYLMAIHLFHKDVEIRKKSRNLFKKYASSDLQNHLKNTWKESCKDKELDRFKKVYHHNKVDLCGFVLAFKMVRWHQANKDGKIDDYFLNRFGYVYLEKVTIKEITEILSECDFIHTLRILPTEPLSESFIFERIKNLPIKSLSIEQSMELFPASFLKISTLEILSLGSFQSSGKMCVPILIGENVSLKELTINHHELIDTDNLKPLINLTRLNLYHTGIKDVSFIEPFKQLNYLNLNNNQIKHLPSFIEEFSLLEYLILDHNPLNSISLNFGKLQKLRTINFSNCELSDLPDSFEGCVSLYDVSLRQNMLKNLPVSLFASSNKSYREINIDASQNQISEICKIKENLKTSILNSLFQSSRRNTPDLSSFNLGRINLSQNLLPEIPTMFFLFKRIRELNMYENPVQSIPSNFKDLKADEIKLSKTNIAEIPVSIFYSNANLINISSNNENICLPEEKDIPTHKSRIFIYGTEKEKEKLEDFRKAVNEKQEKINYEY